LAAALRGRGLEWEVRAQTFVSNEHVYHGLGWNDCSGVDVIVALRPARLWNAAVKPAAKLQNAWAAGLPAILSPEVPYRELRVSDLDYLEAASEADVLAAIDRLRGDPGLYTAMVENGFERAREFRAEFLAARWIDALWHKVPGREPRSPSRLLRQLHRRRLRARYEAGRARPKTRTTRVTSSMVRGGRSCGGAHHLTAASRRREPLPIGPLPSRLRAAFASSPTSAWAVRRG